MPAQTVNIFANPIAGRGRGKAIAERLATCLTADGYVVRTTYDPPANIPLSAVDGPIRAAITIGGDGTLRAIADRLLTLRGDVPPLLPVPLGTANLMVRHLGFTWDDATLEQTASDAIAALRTQDVDASRANGQLFLLMAGIGFDAQVVHELDRVRKGPIQYLSYLMPAAKALWDYAFPPLRVIVDDKELAPAAPAVAFVGNVKEYGTGFAILPYARSDDGVLDVCLLPCANVVELAQLFVQTAMAGHVMSEGVRYVRGTRVRIESEANVPVQLDGDPAGHTPLDIRLLPVKLPFIVP